MPKTPRSEQKIQQVKDRILDIALDIIHQNGFSALSMNKLGAAMHMTAANLYNYFQNKDELYLAVVTQGNLLLLEKIENPVPLKKTLWIK